MKKSHLVFTLSLLWTALVFAGDRYPGQAWMRFATPEEGGFSTEKLAAARDYWESIDSAAALLIHDGAVVFAWGDVDRRYMCHSARKSLLSGLYGIHVDAGRVDLDKTLAELGIDDQPSLTDQEKQATIRNLLQARSGVYRLAAYEPPQNPKPPRGSYPPGSRWCYNNWDFNTLLTILEQEAGIKVFEDFKHRVADPIGMQDYRSRDGYYHYEPEKSIHPAYPFRLSARDMARYGLLFLRQGRWQDQQLLSRQWVRESTTSYSEEAWGGGYGYMWWLPYDPPFKELKMFSARGLGEQSIDVLPGADLVFVIRTDTYNRNRVSSEEKYTLLRKILKARLGVSPENPRLIPLEGLARPWREQPLEESELAVYRGTYLGFTDQPCSVELDGRDLILGTAMGKFGLLPLGGNRFMVEDLEADVYLEKVGKGEVAQILTEDGLNRQGYQLLQLGEVDRAIEIFKKAVLCYPESFNVYDSLGEAYLARGESDKAYASYLKSVQLNPGNLNGIEQLMRLKRGTELIPKDKIKPFRDALVSLKERLLIPGMAVALVKGGKVLYEEGFGYADLDRQTVVTPDTPFRLASITKVFASTVVLQLVEEGRLNLDDPVAQFGIEVESPGTVTVRHLLSHTSEGQPGERYKYNGARFALLDRVIYEVSGKSFAQNLEERVIQPLGLKNTGSNPERLQDKLAKPYRLNSDLKMEPGFYPPYFGTAAGLMASVSDVARFVIALDQGKFISRAMQVQSFTPARSSNGSSLPYGLGWFSQESLGRRLIWHYGFWNCISTLIVKVPEEDLTFVLLCNCDHLSRSFNLGMGDLLSSPAALAFLRTLAVDRSLRQEWPVIDWENTDATTVRRLKSVHNPDLKEVLKKELFSNWMICLLVDYRDAAARLQNLYIQTYTYSRMKTSERRPMLARIDQVGDNEERVVGFSLERDMAVRVYCIGEGTLEGLFDYGWLENADTGTTVWEMDLMKTENAGGDMKNRRVNEVISLPAGRYRLRYRTDDSHSFNRWNSLPPEHLFWGIAVYAEKKAG